MKVGMIGAGNMARAMARGWGDPVLCSDSGSGRARALAEELGGDALDSNAEVADRADLVILAHKPAQLATVAAEIRDRAAVVASVIGGASIATLAEAFPGTPVFRLMPNTPVELRRGVTCYAAAPEVDAQLESELVSLFERLGLVLRLPEYLIEAASAVMGVGPAYQALVAEAQVDAAVRHGLPVRLAAELVVATMAGTAALLAAREYDTLTVRREVASPGGSTARGLKALEAGGVRAAFNDAIDAVLGEGLR
jgi:pyrroline-5-carboxylate reductase